MEFYINLSKAFNLGKLVKKPVQVRGKNGKVFTRMQWVNPEDLSTGHGVRTIRSEGDMIEAMRHGIHKHPDYDRVKQEQEVHHTTHDFNNHPEFHLPETSESQYHARMNGINNHIPHDRESVSGTTHQPKPKPMHEEVFDDWEENMLFDEEFLEGNFGHLHSDMDELAGQIRRGFESSFKGLFGDMSKPELESHFSHPEGEFTAHIQSIWPFDPEEGGDLPESYAEGKSGFHISMQLADRNGEYAGEVRRMVNQTEDGVLEVHNSLLQLEEAHHDKGYGSILYKNSEKLWNTLAKGSEVHINLVANISVGTYAWAKKGFDFDGTSELEKAHQELSDFIEGHGLDKKKIESINGLNSLSDLSTAEQFANLKYDRGFDLSGYTDLKGEAHLGKAFMLLGKTPWKGVRKMGTGEPVLKSLSVEHIHLPYGSEDKEPIKAKRTVEKHHKSKEGLIMRNGKIVPDDRWLHPEVMRKSVPLIIDLSKAFNFAKLVKKPVQVRGKNGKVFTRMQWVSPADVSTGMGMRRISSKQAWENAKKDGIHKHPDYEKALKDQGVHEDTYEDHHPHFFLPETEDSYNNRNERLDAFDDFSEYMKHAEHDVQYNHGQDPPGHMNKIYKEDHFVPKEEEHVELDTNAFQQKHGIHPEIHGIIRSVLEEGSDYYKEGNYPHLGMQLNEISIKLHKHWSTISAHVRDHIKSTTKEKFIQNVQLACLKEGNVKHDLAAAIHPAIAKSVVDHILGQQLADKFRKDIDNHSLCINFPGSRIERYQNGPYKASTMVSTIERNYGKAGLEKWEDIINDPDMSEEEKIKATGDISGDIQARADAEYSAFALTLEDRKPVYIAYNPLNAETGSATYYGNRWMKVNEDVLGDCTVSFDDTFADTRTIPKAHSMEHLKDMFIMKCINRHHEMKYIKQNGEENYSHWWQFMGELPLELQYHKPTVEPDQFEIMPDPADKPIDKYKGTHYDFTDDDDLDVDEDIDLDELTEGIDDDDLGDLDDFDLDDNFDDPDFDHELDDLDDLDLEDLDLKSNDEEYSWDDLFDEEEDKK